MDALTDRRGSYNTGALILSGDYQPFCQPGPVVTNGTIEFVACQVPTNYNGTKGGITMNEKKTEQIAVRITAETKRILQEEAQKLEWSTAKLAEKILSEWTKQTHGNGGAINFVIQNNQNINVNGG